MSNSKFIIDGKLPSLNEYIYEERKNRYMANAFKKYWQLVIRSYIKKQNVKKYDCEVELEINWYEENARRDIDNIIFAKKFILDSMVQCHIIPNDNQKYIKHIDDNVYIDKSYPRIEVNIKEKKIGFNLSFFIGKI